MEETQFAEILLPVSIPGTFTYRVPLVYNSELKIGMRVLVSFGGRRITTGIVKSIHNQVPKSYEAKYILEILDSDPTLNSFQFKLIEWISKYYMCFQGEVLNVLLPTGLKLSSESRIQLNPDIENIDEDKVSEKELKIIAELRSKDSLTFQEVAQLIDQKSIHQLIKNLIQNEYIILFELLKEKYKPKRIRKIKLNDSYLDENNLNELLNSLNSKPQRQDVLMKYLAKVRIYDGENNKGLQKSELDSISESALKTLVKDGILVSFEVNESRLKEIPYEPNKLPLLSEHQTEALGKILTSFLTHDQVLLKGVTGSGKTEIYIHLIEKVISQGQQVLLLVPEIALTTQIVTRLLKHFGNKLGVYHSKFSDNERVEVWKGVASGAIEVVIGVRSSLFLPFDNLGLVIMDEEHEPSYKQVEPAPRYHARETAIMLAHFHHAKIIMASATPSFESFYLAQQNKWAYVSLNQRYGSAKLPVINTIDISLAQKEKKMNGGISFEMLQKIKENKQNGGQSILFQNRRGYSPFIQCEVCTWIPYCPSCSVTLTLHLKTKELKCHYCGYKEPTLTACKSCSSKKLATRGMGTEKLEDELKILFPDFEITRMDLDTTRSKYAYQQIINDFDANKTDILVGTQMVTKGLDFENVTLVGVFDIDRIIQYPDFRSHERAFQILAQVSGRAGRKEKSGEVYIQTYKPNQELFKRVAENDYEGLYDKEIRDRELNLYPPFVRLIKIVFKSPEQEVVQNLAKVFEKNVVLKLGKNRVLGPHTPSVDKVNNLFYQIILVKIEKKGVDIAKVKEYLQNEADVMTKSFKKTTIDFDVDPVF